MMRNLTCVRHVNRHFALTVTMLVAVALVHRGAPTARAQQDRPVTSRQLAQQYLQAYQMGDWEQAINIGRRWTRMKPKSRTAAYNLACAYARHGDKAKGVKWLTKSIELGFDDPMHVQRDPDLDALRGEPGYDKALDMAKEAQQQVLQALREAEPAITTPDEYDASRPSPVIVAMHGFGSNAHAFSRVWQEAAAKAGAILVAPRSLEAVGMDAYRWVDVQQAEVAALSALDAVKQVHNVDETRVVLTGFSQGASVAYYIALRHQDVFKGLVPIAGGWDAQLMLPDAAPASEDEGARDDLRVYIMVGQQDPAYLSNQAAAKVLRDAGHEVKLVTFPGVGHDFPDDRVDEQVKALQYVLQDE